MLFYKRAAMENHNFWIFLVGKSSIDGFYSVAMLNYQRVSYEKMSRKSRVSDPGLISIPIMILFGDLARQKST